MAEEAQHVGVVRERIAALTREFERPSGPRGIGRPLDVELRFEDGPEGKLVYCMMLAAVRFGSGYHQKLAKLPGLSVGQTLVRALTDEFRLSGPPTAAELARVESSDCARWFGQDSSEPTHVELMDLFARSLREFGTAIERDHGGRFEELVRAADRSAVRLVEILARMPFFADVQRYRGLEVPFFLRAQSLAVDLAQTFALEGYGAFDDLGALAPSGDNVIPHVLRIDGVVRYERGLQERIDRGEPVPAHTEREVEIRAAAVHAVDLLATALRAAGVPATDVEVDTWLRVRGRAPTYRAKPRHRSRTVLY